MYKFFFFFLVCGSIQLASAQNHMVKIVQVGDYGVAPSSCLTSDSSVVFAAGLFPDFKGLSVKLNPSGMIDWAKKIYPADTTQISFIPLVMNFQSQIFLAGSIDTMGYIACLDYYGNKIWSKCIDLPGHNSNQVNATSIICDSHFVYVSYSDMNTQSTEGSIIAKFDALGGVIWCKQLHGVNIIVGMVFNSTLGQIAAVSNDQANGFLFSLDTSGNIVSAIYYPGVALTEIVVFTDHSYIVAGTRYLSWFSVLMRVGDDGTMYWSNTYIHSSTGFSETVTALLIDEGFVYAATGASSPVPGNVPSYLMRLDSNGVVVWTKSYAPPCSENYINQLLPLGDGEIMLTGHFGGVTFEMFAIREDSSGTLSCISNLILVHDSSLLIPDSIVNVTSLTISPTVIPALDTITDLILNQYFMCPASIDHNAEMEPQMLLYPNPSDGQITLEGNISGESTIEIWSFSGQMVFETQLQSGQQKVTMNLVLANGVYVIRVTSDSGLVRTQELVIAD